MKSSIQNGQAEKILIDLLFNVKSVELQLTFLIQPNKMIEPVLE